MSSRQVSIEALLNRADTQLRGIAGEYEKSLHAKAIDPSLRIDIKNMCENLRSGLDYIAADIRETHCPRAAAGKRFYFPILPDQQTFDKKVDEWFPDLRTSAPGVVTLLSAVQPFQPGNRWLGDFNQVNNENKHGDLIEQTRVEIQQTKVTGQAGGQVSWTSGVRFGQGVSIMGVPIDPNTQLPVPHPSVKVERTTWVDFHFKGINVSALGLLRAALAGVRRIEGSIRPLL